MIPASGAHIPAGQQRILRRLRAAGAVSPDTAVTPADIGLHDSPLLHGLVRRAVVIRDPGERIHLDESRAREWQLRRRRRLGLALLLVLLALVFWLIRRP
jgi:hypothetical protein